MVKIMVNSEYLDTFDDEPITITKRAKDARELNNLFADYSNSFTLPASKVNNKVFKHYYNFNVIGGFDARIKVPAQIELDSLPLQKGLLSLDRCVLKDGRIDKYKVSFYGSAVNISDLFGELKLSDLNLQAYDHLKTAANVVLGLDSTLQLKGNDVIYPLISKERKWTAADLTGTGTAVQPDELSPAISLTALLDTIQSQFGIGFNTNLADVDNFFKQTHFTKLYLWSPRELAPEDAAVLDVEGTPLPFSDTPTVSNPLILPLIKNETGIYLAMTALTFGVVQEYTSDITITPTTADNYAIKMYGLRTGGGWVLDTLFSSSGTDTFSFAWSTVDYTSVRWYIEADAAFSIDYTRDIDSTFPTSLTLVSDTYTGLLVDTYRSQFRFKVPAMRIIDFFGGLMKMFNLMITPVSSTEFEVKTYDDWKDVSLADTKDFSDRVDNSEIVVTTQKLPKDVKYKYVEPKGISNNKFNELNGIPYGDLEAGIQDGTASSKIIELQFENILWDELTGSSLNVGFSFEDVDSTFISDSGFQDSAMLMYWGDDQTQSIALGGGAAAIASYKLCGSYYPAAEATPATTTHSLNFGSEINNITLNKEDASLYSNYHVNYIDTIFHPAFRIHDFKCYLPPHIIRELELYDVIKLGDVYYNINSMKMDLLKGTVDFELINFTRGLSVTTTPTDTEAPLIGDLRIITNPIITPPVIGVLTLISTTDTVASLSWTAATDDAPIDRYDIYKDTLLEKSVTGTTLNTFITGLTPSTSYDFYIKAVNTGGIESSASNTVTAVTTIVNAPVITSSPNILWYIGESTFKTYQITATNSSDFYGVDLGLPSFLSLNSLTGKISGLVKVTDAGTYNFKVRASNTGGSTWGEYLDVQLIVDVT